MKRFKKVIIWGHPLGSHTHSYIHGGFHRAFKYLGYDTYWLKNGDNISGLNFEDSLFLTEGQVDKGIPIVKSSYYILHNSESEKYKDIKNKLTIQVMTNDKKNIEGVTIFNKYTILENNCLYICWPTDLLPVEIDLESARNNKEGDCVWVGTYGGGNGEFENWSTIDPFFDECKKLGKNIRISTPWSNPISFEENRKVVADSYLAPSIQGKWQVKTGYIPCRIFKNISYGHYGYTNSKDVNDVFDGYLVYSNDTRELAHLAVEKKNDKNHIEELRYLMNEVREKHTYVNRINSILECMPE